MVQYRPRQTQSSVLGDLLNTPLSDMPLIKRAAIFESPMTLLDTEVLRTSLDVPDTAKLCQSCLEGGATSPGLCSPSSSTRYLDLLCLFQLNWSVRYQIQLVTESVAYWYCVKIQLTTTFLWLNHPAVALCHLSHLTFVDWPEINLYLPLIYNALSTIRSIWTLCSNLNLEVCKIKKSHENLQTT